MTRFCLTSEYCCRLASSVIQVKRRLIIFPQHLQLSAIVLGVPCFQKLTCLSFNVVFYLAAPDAKVRLSNVHLWVL